jgi:predicted cation transporter
VADYKYCHPATGFLFSQDAGQDCQVAKWRLAMNTVTLVVVMFILVLVLALQVQVRRTNKTVDHFLKSMGSFMTDVSEYASPKDKKDSIAS